MKIKRILGITGLLLVLLAGIAYHLLFGYVEIQNLNDSVTVLHRKNVLRQIGANITVYAGSNQTIVVDAQLQPIASSMRSRIEKLSQTPIDKLIITHWHPDHSGGIASFSNDTEVYAHQNVLQQLAKAQQGFGLTKPGSQHQFPARTTAGLPTKVVASRLQIPADKIPIEVVHYPHAHTDGDLAVFFHNSKIVAVGDLIWPKSFPFIDVHNGGSAAGLESALKSIIVQSLPSYKFIPGHGEVMTYQDVVEYTKMVSQSRHWTESKLDEGLSADQIYELELPENWSRWTSPLVPSTEWIKMIQNSRDTSTTTISQP